MGCTECKAVQQEEELHFVNARVYKSVDAKGGVDINPKTTAVLCIEFQNEFTTENGKLYPAVKACMAETNMLSNAADVCKAAREQGCKVIHAPIMFKKDGSDNPNKNLGILAGCAKDELFTEDTWNSKFCDAMQPVEGDLIVKGKKGLDAFPGTDLEELLVKNGIETVAICGFLTNCCVESTMRTAFEKGFNVVTLTDCCATTSLEGHKGATEGTFGMFSAPKTAADFTSELQKPNPPPMPNPERYWRTSMIRKNTRAFEADKAKGGCKIDPAKTAVLCIEFQNLFTTENGKLYPAVKDCIAETGILSKTPELCKLARTKGAKVIHAPISFKEDNQDNPNMNLGILAGCAKDNLFLEWSWNAQFCDSMKPEEGDLVVKGKHGLDAFPGTDLEELLNKNGIETVAICGFLTNCCVESTMRTACEKGFNVVTLTDCCATTSLEGHKSATEGTFGMFSNPMTAEDFSAELSNEEKGGD